MNIEFCNELLKINSYTESNQFSFQINQLKYKTLKHSSLKISNLRHTTTQEQLGEALEKFGDIELLNVINTDNVRISQLEYNILTFLSFYIDSFASEFSTPNIV